MAKTILLSVCISVCFYCKGQNTATRLIESTFRIDDPANNRSIGTGFLIYKPFRDTTIHRAYPILVTAHHVLDSIRGDYATLVLRKKTGDDFIKVNFTCRIRVGGRPIWIKYYNFDLAVLRIDLPQELAIEQLSTNLLATDAMLKEVGITPGEDILCLGFPGGTAANDRGFPILRSGKIASYPIMPAAKYPDLYIDFEIFGGNSGGPVLYMSAQRFHDNEVDNRGFQFIMGIVTHQIVSRNTKEELKIASVVPAQFIVNAINMIPGLN